MRTSFRKAGVACGAAFAAALVALSGSGAATASNSALIIGGIDIPSMSDLLMAQLLGGEFKGQERVSINWPAQAGPITGPNDMTLGDSIDVGVANLTAAINTALGKLDRDANGNVINGEKVTVVGLSAGSLVVNEVMRNMIASGDLPDPSDITFIVAEDSSRQELIKDSTKYSSKLDYTYQPAPITPYDIVVVTGEYDGMADFPDRPWNLLAVANAMAGAIVVHVPVMFTDLSKVPAENVTVDVNAKGGTTTHYLVPTATLPLVQMMPFLKPMEAQLRAKIDKGYSRNDPAPATTKALAASSVAEPTVAPVVDSTPASDTVDATPASDTSGSDAAPADAGQPPAKTDATARREARAEARAAAKADAAAARQARQEARAAAKADAAAAREARKEARTAAKAGSAGSSSGGSGSSDSSGSSE
ncbi:membrane protein involved in colicin uptake [Mycolicibacterium chubuense NBB4]|uniref:Membrane protein involved in colicin uptake n=1 Tax=Mycolicibacterium chubuense (strain NBB4) TaxID=710421 RepID=I4BJT5_MYCCN|nr:PE-PPE domain-containing protein [Mycolicibacterium chubuense]AFM17542.1 membrane protein involved in colicin uptake [Mycolicibacterium chubuense NBB4]